MPYNSMYSFQRTSARAYHSHWTDMHGRKFSTSMVGVTGLEPVTLRLSSACSNQLSYTPNYVGGAEETRTPDL